MSDQNNRREGCAEREVLVAEPGFKWDAFVAARANMGLFGERKLVATAGVASAEAIDDIKAVTHHDLSIRNRDGEWEAIVVLDI